MTLNSKRPRVYADFNKWDGDETRRWLILVCRGTFKDLERLGLTLHEGLELTFYADDADGNGVPDDIEADGVVHFDPAQNYWVGIIDWSKIRHASDRLRGDSSQSGD